MKTKKLLSVVLAFVMVMSLLPMSAMAAGFDDTRGHWAEASINRWSDAGVLNGSDGGFNPNGSMTRAQAAQVFTNLLGLKSTEGAQTFTDVPANAWYADAIAKASAAGIMGGVGDGQMNPDGIVSREMFFTMFARALGIKPQETTKGVAADGNSWSAGYINALTDKGFVKGSGSGVDALATMNRASMAALLDQTVSTYANEPGATVTGSGEGVVLVVADNVTVTGSVDTLVVAEGAQDESGAAGVTLQDAAVGSLNVVAKAEVALEGATSVETVAVAEAAGGASVSVGENAKVETVEVAAGSAEISGSGEVAKVEATGAAAAENAAVTVTTPNTEVTKTAETTNADGSVTTTVVESKNDAAGKSTGETKTETTVATTTAADGTVTTTKTVAETKTDAAGTVTSTTKTETTTATATDGSKTETVAKTDANGNTTTTTTTTDASGNTSTDASGNTSTGSGTGGTGSGSTGTGSTGTGSSDSGSTGGLTVTFDLNGHGSSSSLTDIAAGSKIPQPTDPTAAGYVFASGGWYKTKAAADAGTAAEKWDFSTDTVTANTTLYARWTTDTLSSVVIKAEPTKTTYYNSEADTLDLTGLVVTATWSGSSISEDVAYSAATAGDFTVTGYNKASETTQTITVKYKNTGSDTFSVTVIAADAVTGIALDSTSTAKTTYATGAESFDPTGLKIHEVKANGTTGDAIEYSASTFSFSNFDASTAGASKVTVTYGGFSFDLPLTIVDQTVTAIEVKSGPSKKSYKDGEAVDLTGLQINVTYNVGEGETLTYGSGEGANITADTETAVYGMTSFLVSYGGKNATVTGITVAATYTVSVTVVDDSGKNVEGAIVKVDTTEAEYNATTKTYDAKIVNGSNYSITVMKSGYTQGDSSTDKVTVAGADTAASVTLTAPAAGNVVTVAFKVKGQAESTSATVAGLAGVAVTAKTGSAEGTAVATAETNGNGLVTFSLAKSTTYYFVAEKDGYKTTSKEIAVGTADIDGSSDTNDIVLPKYITVTYKANGGTGNDVVDSTTAVTNGSSPVSYTLKAADTFTKAGYTIVDWHSTAAGTGASDTDYGNAGASYSVPATSGDLTMYAIWAKASYTVTFNANEGTGTLTNQVISGDTETALSLFSTGSLAKDGSVFNGWNTKADGTGMSYADGQKVTLYDDLTLYAQWKTASNTAELAGLSVKDGTTGTANTAELAMNRAFSSSNDTYTLSVSNAVEALKITPTLPDGNAASVYITNCEGTALTDDDLSDVATWVSNNASAKVGATGYATINLTQTGVTLNNIAIVVVSESGTVAERYNVAVTREAPAVKVTVLNGQDAVTETKVALMKDGVAKYVATTNNYGIADFGASVIANEYDISVQDKVLTGATKKITVTSGNSAAATVTVGTEYKPYMTLAEGDLWGIDTGILGDYTLTQTDATNYKVTGTSYYVSNWTKFSSGAQGNGHYVYFTFTLPDEVVFDTTNDWTMEILGYETAGPWTIGNSSGKTFASSPMNSSNSDTLAMRLDKAGATVVEANGMQDTASGTFKAFKVTFTKDEETITYTIDVSGLDVIANPEDDITIKLNTTGEANIYSKNTAQIIGAKNDDESTSVAAQAVTVYDRTDRTVYVWGTTVKIDTWSGWGLTEAHAYLKDFVPLKVTKSSGTYTKVSDNSSGISASGGNVVSAPNEWTGEEFFGDTNGHVIGLYHKNDVTTPDDYQLTFTPSGGDDEVTYTIDFSNVTLGSAAAPE